MVPALLTLRDRRSTRWLRGPAAWLVAVAVTAVLVTGPAVAPGRAADDEVRILTAEPASLDPASADDADSAAVVAQLFETLTAFDPSLVLRPALATDWETTDDGRGVIFTLRDGLTFSDGTPLQADDVVRSWLRIIDPEAPSGLASLLDVVVGVAAYRQGRGDTGSVGIRALDPLRVQVDLVRPSADFPAVVSAPVFGIVPPDLDGSADARTAAVSGGYRVDAIETDGIRLVANDRYWAGQPAIGRIRLVTDLGGKSPVEAFEDGELDYAPISPYDASWIRYDQVLGPQLREVPSLTVSYLGFDTAQAPFDDVRVRQAFAAAVDWRRIVELASDGDTEPATSMVPPGVPGHSERDFLPTFDPEKARGLLAEAGYPDGVGFPDVTMMAGIGHEAAVTTQLRENLGVTVAVESMDFGTYLDRLDEDPPQLWGLGWVADYPGRNDFLGVLLGTGASANYSRWSSPEFDAAIAEAQGAADPATEAAAFDRAEEIVQRDVPVVPLEYATSWALSREGLLGAGQNGLTIIRMAGLAWR